MSPFHCRGLDVLSHAIVEIGVLDEITSAVFSTVVRPPVLPGEDEEPAVHGISAQELTDGPVFGEAFRRLVGERTGFRKREAVQDHENLSEAVRFY